MEYDSKNKILVINGKTLSYLDNFTLDFIRVIEEYISYVIVSGYVSILLGRSRSSEDIDLLIPDMPFNKFQEIFNELEKNDFECINTSDVGEAYELWHEFAIKFCKRGKVIPHMEFKVISNDIHKYALDNRVRVMLNERDELYISPLELQIAYKLTLMSNHELDDISSDKNFEDAKHIYEFFRDDLDLEKLLYFVKLFKVEEKFEFLKK